MAKNFSFLLVSDTKKLEKAVNEKDRFSKFFPLERMLQETGCG